MKKLIISFEEKDRPKGWWNGKKNENRNKVKIKYIIKEC